MTAEGTGRGHLIFARALQARQEILASTRDCLVHWAVPSLGRLTRISPTCNNTIIDSRAMARTLMYMAAMSSKSVTSFAKSPLPAGTSCAQPHALGRRRITGGIIGATQIRPIRAFVILQVRGGDALLFNGRAFIGRAGGTHRGT